MLMVTYNMRLFTFYFLSLTKPFVMSQTDNAAGTTSELISELYSLETWKRLAVCPSPSPKSGVGALPGSLHAQEGFYKV